jgi:hypothetical protein
MKASSLIATASNSSVSTTGTVDVAEDHVRLEVQLPWLLSMLGLGGEAGQAHAREAGQAVH